MKTLKVLLDTLPQVGEVIWLGVRPARKEPMVSMSTLTVSPEKGIHGDRYAGRSKSRQVTLVQAEHLLVLKSILNSGIIEPDHLRRNIVVRGINLLALKNREFRIGSLSLTGTGLCHPCSRMEQTLGPGGYNAMRGHGGITAKVLTAGELNVGDSVCL